MSLFMSYSGVGLDIGHDEVRLVRLRPKGGPHMLAAESVKLPDGLVKESFGELNVSDSGELSSIISDLLKSQGIRRKGVGVALPDFAFRVVVLDFDAMPRKAEETDAVIRLRLKKLIPFDVAQAAVRHQYLGNFREGDASSHRFLVTLIRETVLKQYEDCLNSAGLRPNSIGVSSLLAWNLYHDSIVAEAGERRNYALMTFSGRRMSVLVLDRGVVRFFRLKDLGLTDYSDAEGPSLQQTALRELGASLTYYKENFSTSPVDTVYAVCAHDAYAGLKNELEAGSSFDIRRLELDKAVAGTGSASARGGELYRFTAACSAAMER